jgi:hypothetical protein
MAAAQSTSGPDDQALDPAAIACWLSDRSAISFVHLADHLVDDTTSPSKAQVMERLPD